MLTASKERSLILASRSPRRLSLLSLAGFDVKVIPAETSESWPTCDRVELGTCELALRKARFVARTHPGCPVLAADTVVWLAGQVIGKPSSRSHAHEMLASLSGLTHEVVSGVALVLGSDSWTGWERSKVTFRSLSESEILDYLDSAVYADKAGAYGIQEDGRRLVEDWEGPLDTIMGLPMSTVQSLWNQMRASRDLLH